MTYGTDYGVQRKRGAHPRWEAGIRSRFLPHGVLSMNTKGTAETDPDRSGKRALRRAHGLHRPG
jgi:hypothetical protein